MAAPYTPLEQEAVGKLFSAELDFPATPPAVRYMILAAPRTGGTMLGSVLSATRQAGTPFDYLHKLFLTVYARERGPASFASYLQEIVRRRTSPNGRFGLKLQPDQFENMFQKTPDDGMKFLRSFQRFIHLYRRDKIDQAISDMLAYERRLWNTTNPSEKPVERGFRPDDVARISRSLAKLTAMEQYFQALIPRMNLQPILAIAYEDLIADTPAQISRVLAHIGVDIPPEKVPMPKTIKLAGEGSREIKREYLRAIGIQAAA